MDLFSIISEDVESSKDIDEQVERICDFVLNLNDGEIQMVAIAQKARDFEAWDKAAHAMQAFAYTQGLKNEWWRIVDLVKARQKGHFFHSGWDAAFDHAMATLLEPWEGKAWSHKDYELLTAPLKAAGFKP
jgi:hypothetical protein